MIAWTSPWRTVRSMPCRISCVGSAIGRDAEVADDEVVGRCGLGWPARGSSARSVSVRRRGVRGSGGAGGRRVATSGAAGGTRSARVIESSAPLMASLTRTQSRLTVQRAVRSQAAAWRRVLAGADHRGDRALERAQDVAHPDVLGRPRELIAAVGAAGAETPAGVAEAHDELLEIGARQLLLGGDLGQAGRPGAVVARELDHQPDAVLALRREGDGAAAVELGPGAQGWPSNSE